MEQTNSLPNPPAPSEMPTNPPVNSLSSNKPVLIVLLVVLLVVLSSLVTYLLVKAQTKSQTPISSPPTTQPSSTQLSTVIPSPTPNPTANWKTYRNEKYGFKFRYPTLWNLKANDFGKILAIRSDNDILEISVDVLPFGLDNFEKYKKYIEQKKELAAGDILYSTSGFADFEPEEVNRKENDSEDRRSVEYEFKFNKPGRLSYNGLYWSYVSRGSRLVMISFKYGNSNDREVFDQILSTFEFTSP